LRCQWEVFYFVPEDNASGIFIVEACKSGQGKTYEEEDDENAEVRHIRSRVYTGFCVLFV
jgi:hypothetical protein